MVFFRKKQAREINPRTIKLLLIFLLANLVYIAFFGGDSSSPGMMQCDKGALAAIESCKEESSQPKATNVWWFSDAFGALDMKLCSRMSLEEETLTLSIARNNASDTLLKAPCSAIGQTDDNFCYASQHLSADGKIREVRILTTNSHCGEARYFRGQNATLFNYRIKPGLNPSEIIKDMPELKK